MATVYLLWHVRPGFDEQGDEEDAKLLGVFSTARTRSGAASRRSRCSLRRTRSRSSMGRVGLVALVLAVASLGLAVYAWYFAHYQTLDSLVLHCKTIAPPVDCHGASPSSTWPWFLAPALFSALGVWSLRRAASLRGPDSGAPFSAH